MGTSKEQRPGFSFLFTVDSALLLQYVDAQLEKFPPSGGKWKKVFFWGDEPVGSKFWESLKQQGLFHENRAVIVRRVQDWPAQVWKSLDESLARGSSSIWPFFCMEYELGKGRSPKVPIHIKESRCYQFAEKKNWNRYFPPLKGNSLRRYVEDEAKKRALKFSNAALDSFCQAVSKDASAIANELDKLSLIHGEKEVGAEMLDVQSVNLEANAFECIRNLYTGNTVGLRRELVQDGASSLVFALIALLARDFHVFWQIEAGLGPKLSPFDAQIKQNLARHLGKSGISQAFVILANMEYQVKSGKLNPEQALDQLLVELQLLFAH